MPTLEPIGGTIAAIQAGLGIAQAITGKGKMNQLQKQIKAYQTPEELFKILNATQNNAASGLDPFTLNYLTSQTDRTFTGVLGTAERLGADPNNLSALFDQKLQAMMKIGASNHAANLENFSKYLSALNVVGESKAAEQQSQQNIIKDQIQAAASQMKSGLQNIGGGLNTFIASNEAAKTRNLYTENPVGDIGSVAGSAMAGTTVNNSVDYPSLLNLLKGLGNPKPLSNQFGISTVYP